MNSKTVHLLRRYAVIRGQRPRDAKRFWNRLSRNQRHEARKVMEAETE